jgi:dienelactone hydrolase
MKGLGFLMAILGASAALSSPALGALHSEMIEYKDGSTTLEGYLVYDDKVTTPRPAIVIVHQWMGLTDYEKMRADQLAQKGYVAFALDIYGKGQRPKDMTEAGKLITKYKTDFKSLRQRERAALDFIMKQKNVDAQKIVIMGYCFGGGGALEAARGELPVIAAVSFHGSLSTPAPEETKHVTAKLLVLHGALDPFVPSKDVQAFQAEMNSAKADYQFISYSGAVHAFTQKESGTDITKGAAYNEVADKRSWEAFMGFLNEVAPVLK